MGFRFQKRISILPGVRINLSKSGVSGSLGPKGADVNIGTHGVTGNVGIPGTGISYRQKLAGGMAGGRSKGVGILGILAVVGGLGYSAWQHMGKIEKFLGHGTPAVTRTAAAGSANSPVNTAAPDLRYVHREGSVLREEPKPSGKTLKKESKGAQVTLVSDAGDGWSKVTDGNITGYMRSSILGKDPPN